MFKKKRGKVGWPNPQAKQVANMAEKWSVLGRHHTAQTGTHYITLVSVNDDVDDITVRVADHSDAYASADFTVDPCEDQRQAVKAWIRQNGIKPVRKPRGLKLRYPITDNVWSTDRGDVKVTGDPIDVRMSRNTLLDATFIDTNEPIKVYIAQE